MSLLLKKSGLIMGIANDRSIAAAIAKEAFAQGADLGFSHLPDESGKMENRVKKVISSLDSKMLMPCDCNDDKQIDDFFTAASEKLRKIDFLVHSIAFAPIDDIRCKTIDASRSGFLTAMETSVFSFIACAKAAAERMQSGGSILTLSYFGAEKVLPGYNLMGVAKAALEAAVKYLAHDLGSQGIRVNAISAGPIKTLASSAVGDFNTLLKMNASMSPLTRTVSAAEVGKSASFLLSDASSGITGEIMHVDAGFNIMGSPSKENAKNLGIGQ